MGVGDVGGERIESKEKEGGSVEVMWMREWCGEKRYLIQCSFGRGVKEYEKTVRLIVSYKGKGRDM